MAAILGSCSGFLLELDFASESALRTLTIVGEGEGVRDSQGKKRSWAGE